MNLPQNDYQILRLTEHFYNAYPDPPYREVLKKNQRAYNCLLFQTHYDFFICIPYRTEIHHPYAFHFSKTKRSKAHKSEFVERFLELSLFYGLSSPLNSEMICIFPIFDLMRNQQGK